MDMKIEITAEHRWLQALAGEWTYEGECSMGPDQPGMKFAGSETMRSVGEAWIVGEGKGTMPDGSPATTLITVGYDPAKKSFVGTFVGSMMTHLWVYERGSLDAAGKVLTLEAEGPNCMAEGQTAKFRDVVTVEGPDSRVFQGHILGPDGQWHVMMTTRYTRKNAARLAAE